MKCMQRIICQCVDIVGVLYSARGLSAVLCYYINIIQNFSSHIN